MNLKTGQSDQFAPLVRLQRKVRSAEGICLRRAQEDDGLPHPLRRNVDIEVQLADRIYTGRLDLHLHFRRHRL